MKDLDTILDPETVSYAILAAIVIALTVTLATINRVDYEIERQTKALISETL